MTTDAATDEALLAWQWRLYPDNHTDRTSLAIHLVTQPLFALGVVSIVLAPFTSPWLFLVGPLAMVFAVAAQGRGHKRERVAPVPFRGPLDVVRRLVAEQLITWPRFVLTGGFARAWRGQKTGSSTRNAG
jgi:hypothetical protein